MSHSHSCSDFSISDANLELITRTLDAAIGDLELSCPPGCTRLFVNNLTMLLASFAQAETEPATMLRCHDISCRMMEFLTKPRSPEAVVHMANQMPQCRCSEGPLVLQNTPPIMHELTIGPIPLLNDVVFMMTYILAIQLSLRVPQLKRRLVQPRRNQLRARTDCRYLHFPRTIHELLPFGPEASARALVAWLDVPRIGPPIWPILYLLRTMMELVTNQMSRILIGCRSLLPWTMKISIDWLESMERACKLRLMIDPSDFNSVSAFLDVLGATCSSYPKLFTMWALQTVTKAELIDICNRLHFVATTLTANECVTRGREPELASLQQNFAKFASRVILDRSIDSKIELCRLYFTTNRVFVDSLAWYAEMLMKPRPFIIHYVSSMLIEEACTAPDCFRTWTDCERRFHRCGGCRIVSYCSKTCQAKSWSAPTTPHKDICKPLGLVFPVVNGYAWSRKSAAVFAQCIEQIGNLLSEDTIRYLVSNLTSLQELREENLTTSYLGNSNRLEYQIRENSQVEISLPFTNRRLLQGRNILGANSSSHSRTTRKRNRH